MIIVMMIMSFMIEVVDITPYYYYTGSLTTTNSYSQSISKDDIINTIRTERKLLKSAVIELKSYDNVYSNNVRLVNGRKYRYIVRRNGKVIERGVIEIRRNRVYSLNNKVITAIRRN